MSAFKQVMDCQDLRRFIREYLPPHPIAEIMMEQYKIAKLDALILFNIEYNEALFINIFDFKRHIQTCLQCEKKDFYVCEELFCCEECEIKFNEEYENSLWRCANCDYGWIRDDDYCKYWIRSTGNDDFILCPECDTYNNEDN
jgi:hypothetical protein